MVGVSVMMRLCGRRLALKYRACYITLGQTLPANISLAIEIRKNVSDGQHLALHPALHLGTCAHRGSPFGKTWLAASLPHQQPQHTASPNHYNHTNDPNTLRRPTVTTIATTPNTTRRLWVPRRACVSRSSPSSNGALAARPSPPFSSSQLAPIAPPGRGPRPPLPTLFRPSPSALPSEDDRSPLLPPPPLLLVVAGLGLAGDSSTDGSLADGIPSFERGS